MEKDYLVVNVIKTNEFIVMKTSDFNNNYSGYEPVFECDTEEEAQAALKNFK